MLPGLSGMEVLRRLRRVSDVPVILLTARDAVMDKVSGLDTGADDYITKPFAIEELLARIRAGLRKRAAAEPQKDKTPKKLVLTAAGGSLTLDVDRHETRVGDQLVDLTLREFSLLQYLLENKGRVLSRDALLEQVWGYDYAGETNAVDVYVRFLRSKLDERFGLKLIHTVRGIGYQIRDE
jgi:DNA-binding response OmpR family regulator